MKKITDKDVEALKAGKKVTKGFIHMQLDDKGRLNMWADINITDKYRDFEIDASKLFDHGILTEEYDKLRFQTVYISYILMASYILVINGIIRGEMRPYEWR